VSGVHTIPLTLPFVDVLAHGLLVRAGGDRLALPRMTVLLPTQRACRSLREAFLRQTDGPVLLPRMQALGDLDADELTLQGVAEVQPAIPPLRRQVLLAQTLLKAGYSEMPAEAAAFARSLARFFDEMQTEEVELEALRGLTPAEYATHWQEILDFLDKAREAVPMLMEASHAMEPVRRRTMLYDALAKLLLQSPPDQPVILAGSNGSIPAVRRLMKVVAALPKGEVILHGIDQHLDEEAWQEIEPSHPQYAFSRVIGELGLGRAEIGVWPEVDGYTTLRNEAREAAIGEIMRPSGAIDAWQGLDGAAIAKGLEGVSRMECPSARDEAEAIAALFREVLQIPQKRAALVTPDRELARLVAASLRRWDIDVDDSAGQPLAATPPGTLMRLTAAMVTENLAALPLLACLKHPLAEGSLPKGRFRRNARLLELYVLRGPAPAPGWQGLRDGLADSKLDAERKAELAAWLDGLEALAAPFAAALTDGSSPGEILRLHTAFAEALATEEGGIAGGLLWKGENGEALAGFVTDTIAALDGFPEVTAGGYAPLLDSLMAGSVVRSPFGQHPRLSILGTMEARLQQADLVVLGGLNEETWPEASPADPFLSRPMRAALGLPAPEFRIGLSAHDFVTGLGCPEVVLSRALRVKGVPTVASRWMLRLDAVLKAAGTSIPSRNLPLAWMQGLDMPDGPPIPASRPQPRPPLAARPRQMSVSDVQAWIEDPYRLYARKILRLRELEPIGAEPGAADRGTIIHGLLEWFVREMPEKLPDDALERLIDRGRMEFAAHNLSPALQTFWWPRFERIAEWFVANEASRRAEGVFPAAVEVSGALDLAGVDFRITAKADRIDRLGDGLLEIIDYKTGSVPDRRGVEAGDNPQLPLEAAIAEAGKFPGVDAANVAQVTYWKLTGAAEPASTVEVQDWPRDILGRLMRRVRAFDDPDTPYAANPPGAQAERLGYHRAYEHLARLREWTGDGGTDE
jgi:ATP-dependent helicase/nuclease subunit B